MSVDLARQLADAAGGDGEAVGWLYDRFAPRLARRLRGRFGRVPGLDADDLLHDTFVYLLRRRGRVLQRYLGRQPAPTAASFGAFLWSAACGIASNRMRSQARRPTAHLGDGARKATVRGGDAPALARDVLERLARCLAGTSGRAFLYYRLRYHEGLTPAEVSRATGWSRRATYKLKQRLDRALDDCLEAMGEAR